MFVTSSVSCRCSNSSLSGESSSISISVIGSSDALDTFWDVDDVEAAVVDLEDEEDEDAEDEDVDVEDEEVDGAGGSGSLDFFLMALFEGFVGGGTVLRRDALDALDALDWKAAGRLSSFCRMLSVTSFKVCFSA